MFTFEQMQAIMKSFGVDNGNLAVHLMQMFDRTFDDGFRMALAMHTHLSAEKMEEATSKMYKIRESAKLQQEKC